MFTSDVCIYYGWWIVLLRNHTDDPPKQREKKEEKSSVIRSVLIDRHGVGTEKVRIFYNIVAQVWVWMKIIQMENYSVQLRGTETWCECLFEEKKWRWNPQQQQSDKIR